MKYLFFVVIMATIETKENTLALDYIFLKTMDNVLKDEKLNKTLRPLIDVELYIQ